MALSQMRSGNWIFGGSKGVCSVAGIVNDMEVESAVNFQGKNKDGEQLNSHSHSIFAMQLYHEAATTQIDNYAMEKNQAHRHPTVEE